MTKNSRFEDDLNKAKSFFKKKLVRSDDISSSLQDDNYRDLDNETIKISKLSARIDFLKDSLKKKKAKPQPKKLLKKNPQVEKKKIVKKFELSKKHKDINGKPIHNYFSNSNIITTDKYVMLKDFEVNSKLYISGNVNKLPEDLIIDLIEKKIIGQLSKYENNNQNQRKSFFVKETFGLSETKRSSLKNSKNFKK
jgi:hypothetical protein